MNVSSRAREYAPWSISKAQVVETCPLQFEYKYINKVPEVLKATGNQVGTCAHSVLEFRIRGMSEAAAKVAALEKTPLMSDEADTLVSFDGAIESFLQRLDGFIKKQGVTDVLTEVGWGITADYTPTAFFAKDVYFRGKVDLACVTRDKDLIVIDHKSGMARDIARDAKFKHQLDSYAVLAYANVPHLAGVRGGIHFLQGDPAKSLQWNSYIDARRIGSAYAPWLFEYINTVAERIQAPFEGRPQPKWPCAYCSYRPVCAPYNEMLRGAES